MVATSSLLLKPPAVSGAQAFTDRELLRNGGFYLGKTAWALSSSSHVGAGYGKPGAGIPIWPDAFAQDHRTIYQGFYLPTRISWASVGLDYRFLPQPGGAFGQFAVRVVTTDSDLAVVLSVTAYPGDTWQADRYTLNPGR